MQILPGSSGPLLMPGLHIPPACRHLANCIDPGPQEFPKRAGIVGATRETACHADDGYGLILRLFGGLELSYGVIKRPQGSLRNSLLRLGLLFPASMFRKIGTRFAREFSEREPDRLSVSRPAENPGTSPENSMARAMPCPSVSNSRATGIALDIESALRFGNQPHLHFAAHK